MMLKIGLTGGIGSGKTVVAKVFTTLGVPVYHADDEAKRLMKENPDIRTGMISLFGSLAYSNDALNTSYIASVVFSNPKKLKALNEIVHPAVRSDFQAWAKKQSDSKYVIEEAALLFDTGHYKELDFNILVYADKEVRISRVMKRNGESRDNVMRRMQHQIPEERKKKLSDFIIRNNGNDLILDYVLDLNNKFISLHKNKQ